MEEEKEENQKVEEVLIGRRNTQLVPRGGPRRPDTYTRRRHSSVRVKSHHDFSSSTEWPPSVRVTMKNALDTESLMHSNR